MPSDLTNPSPEAIVFDETIPEEKGFAEIFDAQIKPRLLEDVEKRRQAKAETRRRLPRFLCLSLGSLAVFVTAFVVAVVLKDLTMPALTVAMIAAVVGVGSLFWFMMAGNVAYDSLPRLAAVRTVAAQFGLACDSENADASLLAKAFIQPAGGTEVSLGPRLSGKRGTVELEAWPIIRRTRTQKSSQIFFHGWYLRLHLPVTVKSRTAIVERDARYLLAGGAAGMQEVTLESTEFAKRFYVCSDDQIESRVILSPDVIEHISRWVTAFSGYGGLMIGISGENAELAIPTGENRLERWTPQVPTTAIKELHGYFLEIAGLMTFVDGFDALVESEGWRSELERKTS